MLSSPFSLLIVAAYAIAFAVAWHLGPSGRWRALLTDRLRYGVPWGTLVVLGFVLSVYLFVQGGLTNWDDPTTIPFRAWSYLYPTGILTAGFAHNSPGHLIGNLVSTLALAPLVEFAWGHYPGGSRTSGVDTAGAQSTLSTHADAGDRTVDSSGFPREMVTRPWVRALVVFPAAVVLVGLFTAVFAIGPVIGFSGVVFAFAGFAIVRYPLGTLVALFVSSVVSTTYYVLLDPVVYGQIFGSAPSRPWWASIAVQAHAIGFVLGVLLGLALLHRRKLRPAIGRVLLAVIVVGMTRGLWAIYWYEGNGVYVLYRGLGISLVVLLGVVVAVATSASDRPFTAAFDDLPGSPSTREVAAIWLAAVAGLAVLLSLLAVAFGWPLVPTLAITWTAAVALGLPGIWALSPIELDELPTSRQAAAGILLAVLILTAGPAMVPNLVTVGEDPVPNDDAITVEGYTVTYAEDVRNRMIPAIDVPLLGNRTTVQTSGVIVFNENRHIWTTHLSEQYVASEGGGTVTVGGVGWRETVTVDRSGWNVVGNDTVYTVDVSHEAETVRAFRSNASRATPVIEGHTVELYATDDRFRLRVAHENETVGDAPVPPVGNTTSVGSLVFVTRETDGRFAIVAGTDGTRVPIAYRERYRQ